MKIQALISRLVTGILIAGLVMLVSCKTASTAEKKYEREDRKAERAAERSLKKGLKAHAKIQAVETRKMMRKTKREAEKYNSYKRRR